MLYKRVDLKENVPIQFLAVYATNWPFGSDVQPTAGFVEAEDASDLHRQVTALREALKTFLGWANIQDCHSEQARQVRDKARARADSEEVGT